VIPLPSADTETTEPEATETEGPAEALDEGRSALLEALTAELGPALVASHLIPGRELWIRVRNDAWATTADYLHNRQRFRFFEYLSAIDWLPSPYGRSLDAAVDRIVEGESLSGPGDEEGEEVHAGPTGAGSYAGGDTRFQVLARVYSLATKLGVTLKADVGDPGASAGADPGPLTIDSWTPHYPGANWHEREAYEMFGISFTGHPGLRKLYLPGDFEGHPMRKDFPLLARLVKPWPGIVDVEPMPGVADDESPTTTNPEADA
jgi:NADH-quinone oxidoreductase subunit C